MYVSIHRNTFKLSRPVETPVSSFQRALFAETGREGPQATHYRHSGRRGVNGRSQLLIQPVVATY